MTGPSQTPPPWIENPAEARFWFGVREAAIKLRISPVTCYRWIKTGFLTDCYGLPVFRYGNRIFIKLESRHIDRT